MTAVTWPDIRATYAHRYGDQAPGPQLEQQLVDLFQTHPTLFTTEADRAAHDYTNGTIRSPWAILHRRLTERIAQEDRYSHITATDATDRERAIRLAERRLRILAPHLDTERDVLTELFSPPELTADIETLEHMVTATEGTSLQPLAQAQLARTKVIGRQTVDGTGGLLTRWNSPDLRARMLDLWRSLHPAHTDDIPF